MGEDDETASATTPVSRSGGRVRCYAPIPHPPQLPELSERVHTCLENGKFECFDQQRHHSMYVDSYF